MDLFIYFVFGSLFFFIVSSLYFFSRVTIIRLLQQASYVLITFVCSIFFTLVFVVINYLYNNCSQFFTLEPLWLGKIVFFLLCALSLFFIIKLVLPLLPTTFLTTYGQDLIVVSDVPHNAFDRCKKIIKDINGDLLLQTPESLFLIAQISMKDAEKQNTYVLEIKIFSCLWNKSQIHFLCYPAVRGGFIEKKDFEKVIHLISDSLV